MDGKVKVPFALRTIKGIGRRFAVLVCHKAQIDVNRRAGELNEDEVNKVCDIFAKPTGKYLTFLFPRSTFVTRQLIDYNDLCVSLEYGIPEWFLNRQRCIKDGTTTQIFSNIVDTRLREDLERMKKIRKHRGLRHFWGIKVRGQRTKSTGRTGKTLGVTKKK